MVGWRRLAPRSQLVLCNTLLNGQCFGWKQVRDGALVSGGTAAAPHANDGVGGMAAGIKEKRVLQLEDAQSPSKRLKRPRIKEEEPVEIGNMVQGSALDSAFLQNTDDSFLGVVGPWAIQLREKDGFVWFRVLNKGAPSFDQVEHCLRDYFQLDDVDLVQMYAEWGAACRKAAVVGQVLPGMRIIRQDPLECLISFICSSNNNIARITMMLNRLRENFGHVIVMDDAVVSAQAEQADRLPENIKLYQFPTLTQLGGATEQFLRNQGFGYRAKYITQTVAKLANQKPGWLDALRDHPQTEQGIESVREALVSLDGVGPKVADCVALFSLDRRGSVPVDTHVWQIAVRDFDRSLVEAKSLTPQIYKRVGELFRARYGEYAGWAHSLLFTAELPQYMTRLPAGLQREMKQFAAEEKERKLELKAAKLERKRQAEQKQDQATPAPTVKKSHRTVPAVGKESNNSKEPASKARRSRPKRR